MSELFQLNVRDSLKGLVMAVLGAVVGLLLQLLQNGTAIEWKSVAVAALVAALSYILKQLGTDSDGKFAGKV